MHVLHHAAEGGVHGAWMAAELARHGYQISPGSLYPLLHRMESNGLLVSHEEVVDGRLRRVYEATAAGEAELGRLRQAVAELAGEVLGASWRPGDRPRSSPRVHRPPAATAGEGRHRC